jgi:DNA-binding GntR family transcriptional regulator
MPGTGGGTPSRNGNGAVTRSTLRQQIAGALRDEVLAGRLQPGQEFTVKEIADQYGVSATPVREALVDLSAQGLLEAVQHRGFQVHEYSLDDYREMIEARNMVVDGIFRSPERYDHRPRTTAVLSGVRRRAEEARRAATAGELNILIGYDLRYWRELSKLFGNPYLADFLHRLHVQSWVCAVQHLRKLPDLRGRLWAGHTDLVDALVRHDAKASYELVAAHNAHCLALVERLAAG